MIASWFDYSLGHRIEVLGDLERRGAGREHARKEEDTQLVRANHQLRVVLLICSPGSLGHIGTETNVHLSSILMKMLIDFLPGHSQPSAFRKIWADSGVGLDVWHSGSPAFAI